MASPPTATQTTAPPPPPPRKFPAPCWTQEETLALLNSYKDKWYSLRRRNLRTVDWEFVADQVGRLCPHQPVIKTSAQCRHKMEKLRKRYKNEKQRILSTVSNNGRFCASSWVFYDLIDSMEIGTTPKMNHLVSVIPQINNVGRRDLEVKPFSMNHMSTKNGDLGKYFDDIMIGKSRNNEFDVRSAAPDIKFNVNDHHRYNRQDDYSGGDLNNDFEGGGGGFKRKSTNYEKNDEMFSSRKDYGAGSRRKGSVVGEMVASIKMLGEGLVKMEKTKLEMMRDIEMMRMEMEMKRSEMIIESQHLIVTAFVEGLKKNKKVKVTEIE